MTPFYQAGALSPLDGRYAAAVEPFAKAFSEEALLRQRFSVEVEWLLLLAAEPGIVELAPIPPETAAILKDWVADFGPDDVARIKDIEGRINHDVKAVEYYLKERLPAIQATLPPGVTLKFVADQVFRHVRHSRVARTQGTPPRA